MISQTNSSSLEMIIAKLGNLRFIIHLFVFFILFFPHYLPILFAPEFLYDIFSAKNGALLSVIVLLSYTLFIFLLIIWFLFELLSQHRFKESLLLEIVGIPVLLISLAHILNVTTGSSFDKIVEINSGRNPQEFQNLYLSYKMLDCRNLTDHFDVIFIPQHLGIETDYLTYAPRRSAKTMGYITAKNYGKDWYLENSGSQWSDILRNCSLQNRSPN